MAVNFAYLYWVKPSRQLRPTLLLTHFPTLQWRNESEGLKVLVEIVNLLGKGKAAHASKEK